MRRAILPLFFILLGVLVWAESPPPLPSVYWGTVSSSCSLDGGRIYAVVNGDIRGQLPLVEMNEHYYKFGGPGSDENSLIISISPEENGVTTVEFNLCISNRCVTLGQDLLVEDQWKELNFEVNFDTCSLLYPQTQENNTIHEANQLETNLTTPRVEANKEENRGTVAEIREVNEILTTPTTEVEVNIGTEVIDKISISTETPVSHIYARIVVLRTPPVQKKPEGSVIRYLSISLSPDVEEKVREVTVYFRVPVSDVSNPGDVRLAHFKDNEWKIEHTRYLGREGGYYRFSASISSFSYFAVIEVSNKTTKPSEEQPTITSTQENGNEEKPKTIQLTGPTSKEGESSVWTVLLLLVVLVALVPLLRRR